MAIQSFAAFFSNNQVFVRADRNQAIEAQLDAMFGTAPPTNAITLTSIPDNYPRLKEFTNAITPVFGVEPAFIWDSTTPTPGDVKGFATGAILPITVDSSLLVCLQAFADNAFSARVSIYDSAGLFVQDLTPVGDLRDGDMNPLTGIVSDTKPPHGWQNLRYYSNVYTLSNLSTGDYAVILSFEVSYYLVPPNTPANPAALAFVAYVATSPAFIGPA